MEATPATNSGMTKALEKLRVWTWDRCRAPLKDPHPEVAEDDACSTEEGNSGSPAQVRLPLLAIRKLTIIEAEFHSPDPDTLPPEINTVFSYFGARRQRGSHFEGWRFLACHHDGPNLDRVRELEESV